MLPREYIQYVYLCIDGLVLAVKCKNVSVDFSKVTRGIILASKISFIKLLYITFSLIVIDNANLKLSLNLHYSTFVT